MLLMTYNLYYFGLVISQNTKMTLYILHRNYYSLRPLLPVLIRMYLDTKICSDTSVEIIVIGGSSKYLNGQIPVFASKDIGSFWKQYIV
jgi:hypothetical protein